MKSWRPIYSPGKYTCSTPITDNTTPGTHSERPPLTQQSRVSFAEGTSFQQRNDGRVTTVFWYWESECYLRIKWFLSSIKYLSFCLNSVWNIFYWCSFCVLICVLFSWHLLKWFCLMYYYKFERITRNSRTLH